MYVQDTILVMLASGIRVELTATKRVAFHRYSFPAGVSKGILYSILVRYRMGQDDFPFAVLSKSLIRQ